ncbi:hypothetical protein PNI0009_01949 [Streptococcus pneumoniae PNI0009]|nr:hypothetical protein PNI0009_01949 [Streptococcus pneumoniae PNI0009]
MGFFLVLRMRSFVKNKNAYKYVELGNYESYFFKIFPEISC